MLASAPTIAAAVRMSFPWPWVGCLTPLSSLILVAHAIKAGERQVGKVYYCSRYSDVLWEARWSCGREGFRLFSLIFLTPPSAGGECTGLSDS